MNPTQGGWVILLTLIIAMVLSVAHLPRWMPDWIGWLRPEWVVLALFFWVIENPDRVGLILVWVLGLFLDVLYSEPLGINGACLATITFVAWSFYERLRMYSVVQQSAVLFLLVAGLELTKAIVNNLAQDTPISAALILPAITTTLLWPFVAEALRRVSRQFAVK